MGAPAPQRNAARRLARETIALNRRIIERTQKPIEEEDIGIDNFGLEGAIRRLSFIFENVPLKDPVTNQVAYLLRAVMCAQIFNDGNKRTAVVLALAWASASGFEIEASDTEIYNFIVRRFGKCPKWPMEENDILARDGLFEEIVRWLEGEMRRV